MNSFRSLPQLLFSEDRTSIVTEGATREQARADVFDYIEMFYNRKRRHGYLQQLPPVEYEKRYFLKNGTV